MCRNLKVKNWTIKNLSLFLEGRLQIWFGLTIVHLIEAILTRQVALLIADPPPANSTTIHSRLVYQDWNSLFARSSKTAITFKPMQLCNFKILQDFVSPKPVRHSLFYDWFHNFSPFGLGGAVKARKERCYLPNKLINLWTALFVEQHLASPGSAKYLTIY